MPPEETTVEEIHKETLDRRRQEQNKAGTHHESQYSARHGGTNRYGEPAAAGTSPGTEDGT